MDFPRLLLLDNALEHQMYDPLEHWSRVLGFSPVRVHVPGGETLPAPDAFTHVLISGSEASILDPAPWALDELRWLRNAIAAGSRVLGSCWGHQLIARALGGPSCVQRCPTPEFGWRTIEVDPAAGGLADQTFVAFCSHSDQVVPQSHPLMQVWARSAACAVQGLKWGDLPVWGIQAHPEMDRGAATRFLIRAAKKWPEQQAVFQEALATAGGDAPGAPSPISAGPSSGIVPAAPAVPVENGPAARLVQRFLAT